MYAPIRTVASWLQLPSIFYEDISVYGFNMVIGRRLFLLSLLRSSDIVIFFMALYVSFSALRTEWLSIDDIEHATLNIGPLLYLLIFYVAGVWFRELYGFYISKRLSEFWEECIDIIKMTTSLVIWGGLMGIVYNPPFSLLLFLFYFWLSLSGLTIAMRFTMRMLLQYVRMAGRNLRLAVVVGTNELAVDWVAKANQQKEHGIQVLGYVDDPSRKDKVDKYLGSIDELPTLLQTQNIDEVVVALPLRSQYRAIQRAVHYATEQGLQIRYAYPLFNMSTFQPKLESNTLDAEFGFVWSNSPKENAGYAVKRFMDVICASFLLILLSPLMLAVAVIIKTTSDGPVFFLQDRVGLNKRIFKLFKFRSMVVDAEKQLKDLESQNEMDGAAFKIKNDPRITPIGKFIRKTSIDELPQLINVINGDMSLVGPRPLPLRDYKLFDSFWYSRRQSVLPGVTCLWQISGRNTISFEEWMKLDLEYIDTWCLWSDIKILLKTIPVVLKGTGAS